MTRTALTLALCLLATACTAPQARPDAPAATLTLASWNMEHLAEHNGTGCRPRTDADYAAMRAYADALQADVIAFQEVESRAAAERVFDLLMGSDVPPRKDFIVDSAHTLDRERIDA